jgi:mercuric ion transport protein
VRKASAQERAKATAESRPKGGLALVAGGAAAVLASTCCLGPLVLVALGFSGAWIGNLTRLEPYRPLFLCAAGVAMVVAYLRIFRRGKACEAGEVCARGETKSAYKVIFWVVTAMVGMAAAFPYFAPLFY